MAMSVGQEGGDDAPMSEINTTPLVDIMLVLLIIFLITVPVALKVIPVKLPTLAFKQTTTKAENVILAIKGDSAGNCQVFWGTTPVHYSDLLNRAVERFKAEADRLGPDATNPDLFPEVHIRGDVNTPYKCIGGVMSTMQSAGFFRVGFISTPNGVQAKH
jgi:biopolymer transport protein ExbD